MTLKKAKRPRFVFALALVLAVGAGAFQAGSEIFAKLGLTPASAHEGVLDALVGGQAYNDAAFRAFKALAPSARAAVVRGGLGWIKTHVNTAEFKASYARYREEQKPRPSEPVAQADEQMKAQKAELEKNIAEMRKNMAGMDAETRKSLEEAVKQMQAQFEAMAKNPEQMAMMQQGVEMQREENKKQYAEQLSVWEEQYPADPRFLIKTRINEFLETSADVDYAAKLVKSGSKMRFADEAYEEKSAEWKICFRAGREATEAAREFARAWLAELVK
jgi:flagellar biosynthesis GTPase FlhF